jgi:hypothetical protein
MLNSNAKLLQEADRLQRELAESIEEHEQQHGERQLPNRASDADRGEGI